MWLWPVKNNSSVTNFYLESFCLGERTFEWDILRYVYKDYVGMPWDDYVAMSWDDYESMSWDDHVGMSWDE